MSAKTLLLLCPLLLAACATTSEQTQTEPVAAAPAPMPSAFEKAMTHERIIIAGQPNSDDLASLKTRGIQHVFNVRTAEEMSALGFDESQLLNAQGIAYEQHPIASSAAYTPELLAAFAKTVAESDGKVLLHCASGTRAAILYAAYAMKHLGLSPNEAMQTTAAVGAWPLPLERLTGERLQVVRSEDLAKMNFEQVED